MKDEANNNLQDTFSDEFSPIRLLNETPFEGFYLYAFSGLYKLAIENKYAGRIDNIDEATARLLLTSPTHQGNVRVLLFQEPENRANWLNEFNPEIIHVPNEKADMMRQFMLYPFPVNVKGSTRFTTEEEDLLFFITDIIYPHNPSIIINVN